MPSRSTASWCWPPPATPVSARHGARRSRPSARSRADGRRSRLRCALCARRHADAGVGRVPPAFDASTHRRTLRCRVAGRARADARRGRRLDWNHDFRSDVAVCGSRGVQLLLQDGDGAFADQTPAAEPRRSADVVRPGPPTSRWTATSTWSLARATGPTGVLRNNGDGTWRRTSRLPASTGARAFAWADLDRDADPDAAFLDAAGALRVLLNRQAGAFAREPPMSRPRHRRRADRRRSRRRRRVRGGGARPRRASVRACTRAAADLDDARASRAGTAGRRAGRRAVGLVAADLDNNGALDLLASTAGAHADLAGDGSRSRLEPLARRPQRDRGLGGSTSTATACSIWSASRAAGPTRWLGKGSRGYHWKAIRPRAQQNAGDQRINSFGLGGEIEVRSGLLWQKQADRRPAAALRPRRRARHRRRARRVAQRRPAGGVRPAASTTPARRGAAAERIVPVGVRLRRQRAAVRHRLPVALAARACASTRRTRPASSRPRTGCASAAISSRRATAPTTCASPPSCGRRTSSIMCR